MTASKARGIHPCRYGEPGDDAWVQLWWPLHKKIGRFPEMQAEDASVFVSWSHNPDEL